MGFIYRPAFRKRIAMFFLGLVVTELGFPIASYALTSGPSQPEFSSFEPVSTNQLVDEFSGDFTYNIPVLNIPGPQGSDYPLSLSYHSGATPEEEASWVGYGWTLNPGAINRNTRGFPDDFNSVPVTYWNKTPANWTVTTGLSVGKEIFGKDIIGANANFALRYNNYQGYGYNAGAGLSLGKGVVSLGYNVADGQGSFSANVNPTALLVQAREGHNDADKNAATAYKYRSNNGAGQPRLFTGNKVSLLGGNHGLYTYSEANRPNHAANYFGASINVSVGLQLNGLPVPVGPTTNVFGSYSWQQNVEKDNLNAYGYMYSAEGATESSAENAIQDYSVEKDTPYNKRDNFLGIPFNNADIFSVSGEGVGGGFRLYHDKVGEFASNKKQSNLVITSIAPEISVGTTFGLGNDFGAGWQRFSEGSWQEPKDREKFSLANQKNDEVFFRFANDMGGQSTVASDEPIAAQLNRSQLAIPNKTDLRTQLGQTAAHERASFIAYHTVNDVIATTGGNTSPRLARFFSHRQDLPVNYASLSPGAICEMSIATATGGRYIYSLPVLSQKEANLQYGIKNDPLNYNYTASTSRTDNQMDIKVGEERDAAYASSFPLTEIQTADYVDRQLDGPTVDDFGGYTRFNYVKAHGGSNPGQWYNWRTPYSGYLYQINSLSDKADDMGTVSYGKKEVVYLQSVQTKTHTAIFVLAPRSDGRDAGEENGSPLPRARTGEENPGASTKALQKLTRIDLYVNEDVVTVLDPGTQKPLLKARDGARPIKSVHFSYTNDLFSALNNTPSGSPGAYKNFGLPNATFDSNAQHQGKLTLARVWFEYQGVPTKISPYTFSYNYPASYANYPAKYTGTGTQSVLTSSDGLSADPTASYSYFNQLGAAAQNPMYDPLALDAWGNYRKDGAARAGNLQAWLDQQDTGDYLAAHPGTTAIDWDPAAWQLKGITLPTGGQIQVQYEQDDYAFVQDKPVHAMASLLRDPGLGNQYILDLASLGLTTNAEKAATVRAIEDQYVGKDRKIFFKFLYNLAGTPLPTIRPLTPNSEYITGYASVSGVGLTSEGNLSINLTAPTGSDYTLPRQVCKNFLQTQRAGKLAGNDFQANRSGPERAVRDLLAWYKSLVVPGSQCAGFNPALSYFRIPLVKPKKGGGLRVKRLLTFDQTGLDGASVLYGSEYSYRVRTAGGNIISSGVATTEPAAMREENILVDYLPRQSQSLASKIISGIDRKQTEGPLGESLLPAPSVGYSHVVVRNIHSGRTTPGYSVSDFATARDYPMQVKYSALQSATDYRLAYAFLVTNQVNNTYATQGYSFLLNNMHGQVLRRATYAGSYPGPAVTQTLKPTNEERYTYYEPARVVSQQPITAGEPIPVVAEQGSAASKLYPGREVDITSAQRAVKDNMLDLNFETDVDVAIFFFPFFYATVFPSLTKSQAELYTHTTSKVVRYPAVIKRIVTTQEGIQHTTENIAFDRLTGQALQTQATDEFKGGYIQETIPAAWVRPEFGPKWERENRIVTPPTTSASGVSISLGAQNEVWLNFSPTASTCDGLAKITRGDQLAIVTQSNPGDNALYFADNPDFLNSRVRIYPALLPFSSPSTITLPTGVGPNTPISAVQIITSGRMNQLTASASATTYHGPNYADLTTANLATTLPFTTGTKYRNSSFSQAINAWLGTSVQATDKFSSGSTSYPHMNMSAYANRLSVGCVQDPSDVTISTVIVAKQTLNGKIKVSLVSFEVACESGGSVIKIENK